MDEHDGFLAEPPEAFETTAEHIRRISPPTRPQWEYQEFTVSRLSNINEQLEPGWRIHTYLGKRNGFEGAEYHELLLERKVR